MQAPKGRPTEIVRERRFLHYILNQDPKSMINRFFHTQLRQRTKRDWVSTVLRDLDYLGMEGMNMEDIRIMKKSDFMKKVKKEIDLKAFDKLQ